MTPQTKTAALGATKVYSTAMKHGCDGSEAFDEHEYHWTGTVKQNYQDFIVKEITYFKKSSPFTSGDSAVDDGIEVWDYFPVNGTSSSTSNPISFTKANDTSSSSPILIRRTASITNAVDDVMQQGARSLDSTHFITTSSSRVPIDVTGSRCQTSSPTNVYDSLQLQKNQLDENEDLFDNFETAKKFLHQILISLLQGVTGEQEEETAANHVLSLLGQLQVKATHILQQQQPQEEGEEKEFCKIPVGFNKTAPNRKEFVRQFHRLVQFWFPFVTVDTADDLQFSINTTFFDLCPYLLHPVETLLPLYRLRFGTARSNCGTTSNSYDTGDSVVLTLIPETTTKDIRRWIHNKLSTTCRSMRTTTKASNIIIVKRDSAQSTRQKRKRAYPSSNSSTAASSEITPQDQQLQLLCVVQKTGLEHLRCIQTLAQAVSCSLSDIGTAGMKDKRAITTQFMTFRNVSPSRFQNLHLPPNIQLAVEKKWTTTMLSPGMLYRNHFEITVRDIKFQMPYCSSNSSTQLPLLQDAIQHSIQHMKHYGFVNLYGEQRLGIDTDTIPVQSRVGKAVLQQDFWTALDLILHGSQFDNKKIILKGLKRYGKNDSLAVWRSLPYHIRSFYIHSYQSYVWNSVALKRIRRVGARAVLKGDLYQDSNGSVQVVSEPSQVPFSSVLHPLPGTDVRYPDNEIASIYHDILQKDGIVLNGKDCPTESTAKGAYRFLHANAYNLEWDKFLGDEEEKKDCFSAAKFIFELDSGCYATVMLRQLMNPSLE